MGGWGGGVDAGGAGGRGGGGGGRRGGGGGGVGWVGGGEGGRGVARFGASSAGLDVMFAVCVHVARFGYVCASKTMALRRLLEAESSDTGFTNQEKGRCVCVCTFLGVCIIEGGWLQTRLFLFRQTQRSS